MIGRVYNTFLKYGFFKLPYVFVRWQLRKLIGKRRATKLSKLVVEKFLPHNETKFRDLYVSSNLDIARILRGERKILFYGNDPEFKDRDIKSRWELNRFHHAPVVALNYKTFDSKKLLDDLFKIENLNKAHLKTNAMEVSISTINIITAYSLLDEAMRNEYKANVSIFIKKSLVYIFNNLERGILYSANHYFFNIIGILWICESVKEDKFLVSIKTEYYGKLERLLDQFILKDGSLYEGSTYYHKYVTESLLLFLYEFKEKAQRDRLKNSCSQMVTFANYASFNNELVGIGDNDSGRVLGLPSLYRYQSTDLTLLNNLSRRLDLTKSNVKSNVDLVGDDFGLYHISNNSWHLAIRLEVGKRDYRNFIGNHCHNDQLHFTAFFKDMPLFVDSGVHTYIKYNDCRLNALKTSAHNTALINEIEQNKVFNNFQHHRQDAIGQVLKRDDFTFSGQYKHTNQEQNFLHRRKFCLQDGLVVIEDKVKILDQNKMKSLMFNFNLHPDVEIIDYKDTFVILVLNKNYLKIDFSELQGKIKIKKSYYSPEYGLRLKNQKIIFEASPSTRESPKLKTTVKLLSDNYKSEK